jgi:hypothetical protein
MSVTFNPFTGNLDFNDTTKASGSDTQVQFNDGGKLSGDSGLVFNKTTDALTIAGPVIHPLGAAATPSLTFTGDPNTGFWSPAADTLAASTGGSERLRILSDGKVGLGTSSPNQLLEVFQGTGGTLNGLARFASRNVSNTKFLEISVNGNEIAPVANITASQTGGTATPIAFVTGTPSTERVRITAAGNVGIGTTSPAYALHVVGTINSSDASNGFRTALTNGLFQAREFGGTSANNTLEFNIRPDSGKSGYLTFTETSVADRWSIGIQNGSDGLRFISGTPTSGTERCRIDGSGRLLVGTSTARSNFFNTTYATKLQVEDTGSTASFSLTANTSNTAESAYIVLARSNGTSIGSNTIVASGNSLGVIEFEGSDGTEFVGAARISAQVDGTPGANDMPGRLVMSVTLDGASSPTEALRITNDRVVAYNQAAPAAVNATATLTVANLKTGIITSTSAAATDMTLPTGTDTEGGFSGIYTNMTFEWSVINTGPSLVTVLANTAHTLVGSGAVATGTSARFASRRSGANTFVTYRLS